MQVVSKACSNITFTDEEKAILSSSTACPDESSQYVKTEWNAMESAINAIIANLDCSIFTVSDAGAGCDAVVLCRDSIEINALHFVAVELKDARGTKRDDWNSKLEKLMSFRCIIPRLRARLLTEKNLYLHLHVVLAGREG